MEERQKAVLSGWVMLPVILAWWGVTGWLFYKGVSGGHVGLIITAVISLPLVILFSTGFFTLQPNEGRVLVLFGKYVGTVRTDGFHWANPFSVHRDWPTVAMQDGKQVVRSGAGKKYKISLRVQNFETATLKVNDQRGNPIEIGAVVVWRVENTAKAFFDVDKYEEYIKVQSETAVRHLANSYPYDHSSSDDSPGGEITLRGNSDKINVALEKELRERLARAGVNIEEARLTHLAYAPEIAGVMLRRQQAEAIIAARQKIVHGAVSMVEMALTELSQRKVLELDEERKAAMVSNLLVVLCGEGQAEPVINTGTLYH